MQILDVQQTQLDYVAVLERPAFPLWTNVPGMMSGLYQAFEGLHPGLGGLTVEGDAQDPLGRAVSVDLGAQGTFRVAYDRVEVILSQYTADDLAAFPATLSKSDWWLRSHWAGAVVLGHYLTFSVHGALRDSTSADFLRAVCPLELPGIGNSLGTGLIFHAALPGTAWELHLTLDHSNVVEEGLFVQYVVTIGEDRIDHATALGTSAGLLDRAAESLELVIGAVE